FQSFKCCSPARLLVWDHPADRPLQDPVRHPWIVRSFPVRPDLPLVFIMGFNHTFFPGDDSLLAVDDSDLFTVQETFCHNRAESSHDCPFGINNCYHSYPNILMSFPFGLCFTSSSMDSVFPPAFFIFS